MDNALKNILNGIASLLDPLRGAVQNEESLKRFFRNMGWNFDDFTGMPITDIQNSLNELIQLLESVEDLVNDKEDIDIKELTTLLSSTQALFEQVSGLVNSFDSTDLTAASVDAGQLTEDIIQDLLVTYLYRELEIIPAILGLLDIITIKENDSTVFNSDGKIVRYPYTFEVIDFENIGKFISDPVQAFKDIYITPFDRNTVAGAKDFTDKLFPMIGGLANVVGGVPVYGIKPAYEINFGDVGNEMVSGVLSVQWQTPLEELSFGVIVAYSPRDRGDLGWVIVPSGELTLDASLDDYYFVIQSELQIGAIVISDEGQVSFESAGGLTRVKIQLEATKLADNETGLSYLIGDREGTRFEIGEVSIGGLLEISTSTIDSDIHFNIGDAKIVISSSGQDGFMSSILPEDGIEVPFDFLLGYSTQKSLYFGVDAGLILALPVHIDLLGILKIFEVYLKITTEDYGLKSEASISGGVSLGPLDATFEEIGLKANLDWTKDDKNIGFADFSLDFKPPNGLGLSLDAGVVKGGGYLFFDFDREEYAGALELVFSEWIALKAVGLITTKMPDGSEGFSMLIIITVEFGTGLQLGFGFTLLGVGGLLGLNRIVNIEPLKEAIRTGAVESVMFPQDVIANAPRIISDLRKFFPPQDDLFLIGPMAKIGWGTPNLMSISIGLILEVPSINITILGVLKVVLPDENADVLRLQVNFIGRIEPSNNLLWFYAELFDSRVLFITLEGGMGLLVNWGDNANFVVSVGGFHPKYSPPPLPFPEPPRIAVNILNESYAKVRIEAYFAVTSNSVQFGAKAELFFGVSEFNIEGFLIFDALFQFDPFFFSFGLSVSLSVTVFGIGLFSVGFSGLLEGPAPWYIKGKGSISLLFFDISVPFEHTWGEEEDTKLDPIEVFPLLEKEFDALTNWQAQLPASSNILVSLRKLGGSEEDGLVLHPVGTLSISQRKLPVNFKLDKVGNQQPADVNQLYVDAAINGAGLSITQIEEKFAIGQFKELDDSERLSSPAFEPLDSGVEMAVEGEQMKTSQAAKRVIRYETIVIDNNYKRHVKRFFAFFNVGFAVLYEFLFTHFLAGNAVTKSVLSQHHKKRMQPFEEVIQIQPDKYSVAFNTNNQPVDEAAAAFTSQAKATQYMEQKIQGDPQLTNTLHVIPNTEITMAA